MVARRENENPREYLQRVHYMGHFFERTFELHCLFLRNFLKRCVKRAALGFFFYAYTFSKWSGESEERGLPRKGWRPFDLP